MSKSVIPDETMESMKEFFMKTSVPRMIAKKKKEQEQSNKESQKHNKSK